MIAEALDGEYAASMFAYVDRGSVAFVDFALTNPALEGSVRFTALAGCFRWIKERVKYCKCRYIYTVTKIEKYQSFLELVGMKECESDMKSYILPLYDQDISALI